MNLSIATSTPSTPARSHTGRVFKRTLLVLMAASLFASSHLGARVSFQNSTEYTILWADSQQTEALFVPQKVLDQSSVSSLPLSQDDAALLSGRVQSATGFAAAPGCHWQSSDPEAMRQPGPDAMPLEDFLSSGTMTFLGRVTAVVPGWLTSEDRAASVAYVEVERALYTHPGLPKSSAPTVGSVVAVPFIEAQIQVEGAQLCSTLDDGLYQPRVKDQIIVNGYPSAEDARVFFGVPFLVFDDRVWPGDVGLVLERSGQPVEALIDALTGSSWGFAP